MSTPSHIRSIGRVLDFPWSEWKNMEFSDPDKIELDKWTETLKLRKNTPSPEGRYPTDDGLFIRGPSFNPQALKHWKGFYTVTVEPTDTLVQYRIHNATTAEDLWWDGVEWSEAETGEWNTLTEVHENIEDLTANNIRIVYNLKTTDDRVTPQVNESVILFEATITNFIVEYIYRTFIRHIKDNIAPEADVTIAWPGGTTTTFTYTGMEEPPGTLRTVTAAFDYTSDPYLETDLLFSYNPGTGDLVLAQSVTADNVVVLRVEYEPLVVVRTHPDYDEISGLPAIIVDSIAETFVREGQAYTYVVNKSTYEAMAVRAPRQVNYDLSLVIATARSGDLFAVAEALETLLRRSPMALCNSLDTKIGLSILLGFSTTPRVDESHMHEGNLTVRLWTCDKWLYPIADATSSDPDIEKVYGTKQVNTSVGDP